MTDEESDNSNDMTVRREDISSNSPSQHQLPAPPPLRAAPSGKQFHQLLNCFTGKLDRFVRRHFPLEKKSGSLMLLEQ
jgi:hypothetical protein